MVVNRMIITLWGSNCYGVGSVGDDEEEPVYLYNSEYKL